MDLWKYGHIVTMPDFGFHGVSSSLAEFIFFFLTFVFNFFCIMYVTQKPQTTDSTRAVQGACNNQPAATICTPAACQQSKKQHHTRGLSALYYCGFLRSCFLLLDPAICRPAGLCCCVIHACATGTSTQIFHNVVI